MDMDQEVDVKLFITCRLCLDEPGSYQIVPFIKGQINFCFGIDIDPFDGLPQLICKKCKCTLTEFYVTKNTFLEKQKKLQAKLLKDNKGAQISVEPERNKLVHADGASNGATVKSPEATDVTPHRNSVISLSASDLAPLGNSEQVSDAADIACHSNSKKRKASWKKAYNKHFVCTICNKGYLTEKSVKNHIAVHNKLTSKHAKIFNIYLTVQLNKIDKKKNSTGCLQNVVYSKDKIIGERGNSNYYSFYLRKGFKPDNTTDENENVAVKRPRALSDSSEDEIKIIKGKKRKSCRLFTTSSTKTIILEETEEECNSTKNIANMDNLIIPDETEIVNAECINLDDTSSDCPPKKKTEIERTRTLAQRQRAKAKVSDYKAIQSIVTMCHKNYIKKIQSENDASNKSKFSESSLKHKVLSLGRKVINKQGFSCIGLLRYVEHKDLEITWTPTSNATQNKGSNFVRIMTKLKSREDSENEDAGWKNLHDISFCRDGGVDGNTLTTATAAIGSDAQASLQPGLTDEDQSLANNPCESNDLNHKNKLLNKTPVANPKQLPKKNNMMDLKPVIIKANDAALLQTTFVSSELEHVLADHSNMCLPIITSTTSLSTAISVKEKEDPNTEKPTPRIKVKPASELMSERALSNQEAADDIWAFNMRHSTLPHNLTNTTVYVAAAPMTEALSGFTSGMAPMTYQNDTQSLMDEAIHKDEQNRNLEYVTLHSPELPNTKTKSPFHYFKTVLLVHGLKLLDLNDDLSLRFNCLIKFKLMLKQDTKRPIGVLLSLFCSKNTFCFTFKDTNSKKFDPNQLPAFWQWELLKIYKGDVVDKILQNALKIGKDVHEFTKHFLCLLKSIDLIMES